MMAKFRVQGTPRLPILEVKQAVSATLAENNSDQAVRLVIGNMKPIVRDHYNNAVQQVAFKLRGLGIPAGVTSSGPRMISYGKVGGGVGMFRTKPWKALTDKYRRKHYNINDGGAIPASYKFWIKTGALRDAVNVMVKRTYRVYLEEKRSKRNHHKNRINTTVVLTMDTLPFPFERAVSLPFILGSDFVAMKDMSQPVTRGGLGRARFAEQNRPFLRKMSAFLGKQMRADITKKLRKL
jgi:hypothetical protein